MKAWPPPPWIGSSGLPQSTYTTPENADWLTFYQSLSPKERLQYECDFPAPVGGLYDALRKVATVEQSRQLVEKMWGNTTFK